MRFGKTGTAFALGLGMWASGFSGSLAETLKIGVISPLTGGGAPWGIAAKEATKILAEDINAAGGLGVGGKKYRIEVISYDDQYKAASSVAAYNRLVNQDGVKYVLIHTSPAAVALRQNVEDDKVVGITAASSPNAFSDKPRYMFRMLSVPTDYMPSLIGWMKDHLKQRRIAILNPNDETGFDQARITEKLLDENGFQVLRNEMYERSEKDFQPIFTKLIALNPEIIDLGSAPPATTGLMVRQARELGFKGLFVKTSGPSPKEIVAAAGKDAAEGMIVTLFADPGSQGYRRIAAAYKKEIGQEPNEMLLPCYDGMSVLLRAIQAAGDVNDTAKVSAAFAKALPMRSVQGDDLTLGGRDTIGVDHQVMTTIYIGEIKNGEPVVIGKAK